MTGDAITRICPNVPSSRIIGREITEKCLNKQNLEIERKGSLQSSVSFNSQRSTRSHFSCNGLILPVNRECFYVTGTLSFISLVSGFILKVQS